MHVKMKYLSEQKLVEICNIFGCLESMEMKAVGWYLDELLEYVIANNRCDELLRYLFDRDKFRDFLKRRTLEDINN